MLDNERDKSVSKNNSKIIITESVFQLNNELSETQNLSRGSTKIPTEKDIVEENLIFDYKYVFPLKLYYAISDKLDIFLMILATILTIGAGLSTAIKSSLLGDAINNLATTVGTTDLPDDEYEQLMDSVEPEVNRTIKKFLIYGSIMFVFNFLSQFLWLFSGLRQMHNLKINYFSIILHQEQSWFEANNIFELGTKVQAQIEAIQPAFGETLGYLILRTIEVISGYYMGFKTSWKLTLILSACGLPFIIGGFFLMRYGIRTQKLINLRMQQKAGGIAEELLYNIKTVASFANFDYEIQRYDKAFQSPNLKKIPKTINSSIVQGIVNLGIYLGFTITCIYSRTLINSDYDIDNVNHTFTSGDVVTVLVAIRAAFISLIDIPPILLSIREACASASDFFSLSEREPKIITSKKNIIINRDEIKGKIEFKNVHFSYPDVERGDKPVLNGLDLIIEAGKKIALVGESGCGKSTAVSLIERLYEASEGEILLDGININEYNLEFLRSLIGYVKQETFLLNQSIRNNLLFGREEKIKQLGDIDELIDESCTDAGIKDFIMKKPDKYDYNVGIRGMKLLPSQRQRISIARALMARPKIIILDEATSSLDNEAEKKVQTALDNINKKNITTLIIGNRLNIIKNADMIYVLKEGKVIEKGNHDELIEKKGYYAGLIKQEIKKEILGVKDIKEKMKLKNMRNLTLKFTGFAGKTMKYDTEQEGEDDIKFELSKILELVKDHKIDIVIGIIGGLIYGAYIPCLSLLLGKITTSFALKDNSEMRSEVLKWSLVLLAITIVANVCNYFKALKISALGSTVTSKLRKNLFKKYLELHMGFFDFESNNPNELLSIISVEINYIKLIFTTILGAIVITAGMIITGMIIGFYYDWKLTLILLCFFPFRIIFSYLVGKFKVGGKRKYKMIRIEASLFFSEIVANTKTLYSYNYQNCAIELYKNILEKENCDYIKDSIIISVLQSLGNFLTYASNSVAYKCAMKFIRDRKLTFGTMNNVKKTLMSYLETSDITIRGLSDFIKVKNGYKGVFRILNSKSEINALEEYNQDKKNINDNEFKGKIEFKNVTFSYPTKPNFKILKNISFIIPPGGKVAIVGSSESGKSTIIRLIERFYDVNKGEILIDDVNIKEYNLYQLRKKIGLISQEPVLFKRKIYENILYGDLTAERNQVFEAADKAFISKMLYNKEFKIKDNFGSFGEKQRLSIARVILKNPAILLTDEATSALDNESEKEIKKSISELQKGRTSVSITHRLLNIIGYDLILYLENGQIVEKGNHDQLINQKGKYYKLFSLSKK